MEKPSDAGRKGVSYCVITWWGRAKSAEKMSEYLCMIWKTEGPVALVKNCFLLLHSFLGVASAMC